jgi:hypothetical protein
MLSTNLSSIWNGTNEESIALYHHPVLYGAAIYALLLIFIGTIGKSILNSTNKIKYS